MVASKSVSKMRGMRGTDRLHDQIERLEAPRPRLSGPSSGIMCHPDARPEDVALRAVYGAHSSAREWRNW